MSNPTNNATTAVDYNRCPILCTHRRLAEAHLLWHQALVNYQRPEGFRANLNAAIQARNTIVKQGELEIASTASVKVLTWKGHPLTEVNVPAGVSTALILKNIELLELLKSPDIPPGDLREAALAIERRWSVA